MNIQEIREQGIGNGFSVLNPADGYRKDNSLWFGECSECGERITNSHLNGIWEHTKVFEVGHYTKEYFDKGLDGLANYKRSKHIDYCPKVAGEVFVTIRWCFENGKRYYA